MCGIIDGYAKVGKQPDDNHFTHCPGFSFEIQGGNLIENGAMKKELERIKMFVSIERMSDQPASRDLSDKLEVEPLSGPTGFLPVHCLSRQIDDAKVGTSATCIRFQKFIKRKEELNHTKQMIYPHQCHSDILARSQCV